jgi:hypothetical protein
MEDLTPGADESKAPKKKKAARTLLHKNEILIEETSNGYLFHKGNGVVYYRANAEEDLYHEENEKHTEEAKNLPPRYQNQRG